MHNCYNESFHIQGIKVHFYYLKRNERLECSRINLKYIFAFLLSKKKKKGALVNVIPKNI